jgi:hypothetical protein
MSQSTSTQEKTIFNSMNWIQPYYTGESNITMDEILNMNIGELSEVDLEEEAKWILEIADQVAVEAIDKVVPTDYQIQRVQSRQIEQREHDQSVEESMEIANKFNKEIEHLTKSELQSLLTQYETYIYTPYTLADIHIWNAWKILQLQKKMTSMKASDTIPL